MADMAYQGADGKPEPQKGTSGAAHVADHAVHPGEDDTLGRTWGGTLHEIGATAHTGDGQAFTGPAVYGGYIVQVATATAAINIHHGTDNTGPILASIPAGSAIAAQSVLGAQISCPNGIYVDFTGAATGTIVVLGA